MKEPQNHKARLVLLAFVGVVLLWYQSLGLKQKTISHNVLQKEKTKISRNKKSTKIESSKQKKKSVVFGHQIQTAKKKSLVKVKRSKAIIRDVANNKKAKLSSKSYSGKYNDLFEENFELGVGDFLISSNLVAEPREEGSVRVPLFRVGNFNVYEETIEAPLSHHQKPRVVYNSSTKRYAILTGLVFIRFDKKLEVEEIEELLPVSVKETIDHLNFNVVIPNDGISIIEIEKQIKSLDNVEEFEIEILEGGLHEK